jgi:hypothetical protein
MRVSATELMEETSPLSPQRAFVVQFRAGAGVEPVRFTGRVEHMASGQATRFESVEDLVTFVTQVLTEVRD